MFNILKCFKQLLQNQNFHATSYSPAVLELQIVPISLWQTKKQIQYLKFLYSFPLATIHEGCL